MSFNVALSGLAAANKDLAVTGNNIANVATTGFKGSRAEFADVYSASILGTGGKVAGAGVRTAAISQQFTQGNINNTGNSLDLAVNGNGFFALSAQGQMMYTRAGEFGTDKDGYIVNSAGYKLQGYGINSAGDIVAGQKVDLQLDSSNVAPKATTQITETLNLDSSAKAITLAFDPQNTNTYNWATSVPMYDSLGNAHTMSQYFTKTAGGNWTMQVLVDGRNPADPSQEPPVPETVDLVFDSSGALDTATAGTPGITVNADGTFSLTNWLPGEQRADGTWAGNGSAAVASVDIDMTKMTQYNAVSSVTTQTQDGYATGQLAGLNIDETGVMFASYTNGQSKQIGQVMLVNFSNVQGLKPVGGTAWLETYASGVPVEGTAKTGTFGAMQAGALEESNVDLTAQLVQLIKAQSNYQANAKTVTTESTILQTTIQMG
ncbi:flagellar hook protein FlgE [Serpens gallinarum]|uniref:Flagellar hook protein FlgE n=1 Tax=Serpens gallinarum TaxID=2763075 RepID=A0ABR8TRG6_9PSED|nr:flagellar hook protein FlgE [Serpens gallinarum]MBD7978362.1 flagellar hook protein FlgE [Serpens gallinarum]